MILNPEHRKEMCYQPKTEDSEKDKSLKELIGNALQLKGWAGGSREMDANPHLGESDV